MAGHAGISNGDAAELSQVEAGAENFEDSLVAILGNARELVSPFY